MILLFLGSAHEAQAQDVSLSQLPVADLLAQLADHRNLGEFQDDTVQHDITILNDTDDQVQWYFRTEILQPIAFTFYDATRHVPIFQSTFEAREQKSHASQGPVLVSELITLRPGDTFTLGMRFETQPGPEHFPISLITKDDHDQFERQRGLSHGMFFGAMLILAVLFLLSPNYLLNAASNWFGLYIISMALLNMHSHGYGLYLFDLGASLHFPIIRLLHACVMLFYLLFVLSFLRAAQAYRGYWLSVWVFIGVSLSIAIIEQLLASAQFQSVANLVPLGFLIIGGWGAFLAVRDNLHGAHFFMAGYVVLLTGGWLNYLGSLPQFVVWNEQIDQATLLLQIFDALIFGSAILNQVYGIRDERDRAVEGQLVEARRRLELNQKLQAARGDLRSAKSLAEQHRATLAATSHDLRQPLASLRIALETAKVRMPELVSDLSTGIDFLDDLLGQILVETRAKGQDAYPSYAVAETLELQLILQNVQRMFAKEAAQKGVMLHVVNSSISVHIPAIDLIRMVSNLTANAVRHAQSKRILIGVRRRSGKAAIEVWDSGCGLPPEQLEHVMLPYARGTVTSDASGEGLGLSIVKKLADDNKLTFKACSLHGKGSVFRIAGLNIVTEPGAAQTDT